MCCAAYACKRTRIHSSFCVDRETRVGLGVSHADMQLAVLAIGCPFLLTLLPIYQQATCNVRQYNCKSQVDCMVAQEVGFRPSKLRVDVAMRAVSLVLCNDKLSTYGAPDVLQVSVDQLDAHFSRDRCFADRPSNQAWPLGELLPDKCTLFWCSWLSVLVFILSCTDGDLVLMGKRLCGVNTLCSDPLQSTPLRMQHAQLLVQLRLLFYNLRMS